MYRNLKVKYCFIAKNMKKKISLLFVMNGKDLNGNLNKPNKIIIKIKVFNNKFIK